MFSYDLNGNVTESTENSDKQTFTYDALGRVKTNSQFNESYEYDPRENRISRISEQDLAIESATYAHDEWNRLTQVTNDSDETVNWLYAFQGLFGKQVFCYQQGSGYEKKLKVSFDRIPKMEK